jgi:hypothetical protein
MGLCGQPADRVDRVRTWFGLGLDEASELFLTRCAITIEHSPTQTLLHCEFPRLEVSRNEFVSVLEVLPIRTEVITGYSSPASVLGVG